MKNTIDYIPDNWVIFYIKNNEEIIYKILAGWSGSYLYGTSWKINSGISKIEEAENEYYIHGYSGSIYCCRKNSEMLRFNNEYVWNDIKNKHNDNVDIISIDQIKEKKLIHIIKLTNNEFYNY